MKPFSAYTLLLFAYFVTAPAVAYQHAIIRCNVSQVVVDGIPADGSESVRACVSREGQNRYSGVRGGLNLERSVLGIDFLNYTEGFGRAEFVIDWQAVDNRQYRDAIPHAQIVQSVQAERGSSQQVYIAMEADRFRTEGSRSNSRQPYSYFEGFFESPRHLPAAAEDERARVVMGCNVYPVDSCGTYPRVNSLPLPQWNATAGEQGIQFDQNGSPVVN